MLKMLVFSIACAFLLTACGGGVVFVKLNGDVRADAKKVVIFPAFGMG